MPESLTEAAARSAATGAAVVVDAQLLLDRCDALQAAIHNAIAFDSIRPLTAILDELDIACEGDDCNRASHPKLSGLCMICLRKAKALDAAEEIALYDRANNGSARDS